MDTEEVYSENFSDTGSTKSINCWKLIDNQPYAARFWLETISLTAMNGLVIFGNLLVALAPFLNRGLSNPSHYFIASLAWADFGLGVFVLPIAASVQTRGAIWPYGSYACQIWQALDITLCTASIYSLIAITFDRYVAVSKPLMYKSWMTGRTCTVLIVLVWLCSLAVSLPSLPLTWSRNVHTVTTACKCTSAANGSPFIFYSSISSFYLPMIVIIYFYAHIYIAVRKIRLSDTRGVINLRHRSPTTTTGGLSINNNTEFQDAFLDASAAAVSNVEARNKKFFSQNRLSKRFRFATQLAKSLDEERRNEKIQDENTNLLVPETPQHQRRISDGPVLRIHKGGYHAKRSCDKKANGTVELKPATQTNKILANDKPVEALGDVDMGDEKNRSRIDIRDGLAIVDGEVVKFQPPPSTVGRLRGSGPSPSQQTLSAIGIPSDLDNVSRSKKSKSLRLSQRGAPIDLKSKIEKLCPTATRAQEEKPDLANDVWLRLTLPSQLVAAWAQRMLSLHRYRRKLSLELRALKTVVMVTGCFFVCWTGFCVVYTMHALPTCHRSDWWSLTKEPRTDDSCLPDWLFNLFVWLGYANSAANPIVYGATNAQFRRTFRRLLTKACSRLHAV